MKILLIFPLNESFEGITTANKTSWKSKLNSYKNIKKIDCAYPTGLLAISSYIQKNVPGAHLKILDFNAVLNQVAEKKNLSGETFQDYSFDDFLNESLLKLDGFIPDIIGVSTLFCSVYRDLKPLSSFLRNRYLQSFIVCGGHVASSLYNRMYSDNLDFDAVAFGEGEIPMLELVQATIAGKRKEYLAESKCWVTKEKVTNDAHFSPQNLAIQNLDDIPAFDLDAIVFPDTYFNSTKYFFVIESTKEKKEMFMFSSRGCPYHCVFCASQNVHGHNVRSYSVQRIKEDILYYEKKYGITRFVFYDDHFLVHKKRAIEILNFISERGLTAEIPTPAFFSIDKEIAAAMKKAGIKEVNITIESGNEDTLKRIMQKPSNLKKAIEAVEILHNEGIIAVANILIGLPGETKEAIEIGLEFLLTTPINWFQVFVVAPLPGSKLYDICKDNGYFSVDDPILVMDYKRCVIRTKDFDPEYIENKAYEMNLQLNFIHNYDFRSGNYETALMFFERIVSTVIDTHAFAYFHAAKCCKALQLDEKYVYYMGKYREMIEKFPFWRDYATKFGLPT